MKMVPVVGTMYSQINSIGQNFYNALKYFK